MKDFIDRLKEGEILVCDGGMGTSLHAAGLEAGQAPEEVNVSNPTAVVNIHRGFIDAGCDMIITNTFGANPIKLKRAGLEVRVTEINTLGVGLAKEAARHQDVGGQANDAVYVLGDIGPTGEFLTPIGTYDYQQFYDAFFKQAIILHKGRVDAFIIETMSDIGELKAAVSACKAVCDLPIIASMTFMLGQKGYRTMMGVSVEGAVKEMINLRCSVIGANCGCGSQQMLGIMKAMKKIAGKNTFLISQPNAGVPKLVDGETKFSESAQDFSKAIRELVKLGINIIGGCCGTTPQHIREIARMVKG